jgi:hypothetical protein
MVSTETPKFACFQHIKLVYEAEGTIDTDAMKQVRSVTIRTQS